ncbi:MAG: hypothetical protein NXI24_22380 [bacterium]|nr:hypothetical protein [bacterium]
MNPREKQAILVLVAGGVFFLLAIGSYIYAEYALRYHQPALETVYAAELEVCDAAAHAERLVCIEKAGADRLDRQAEFRERTLLFVWHLPLIFITLSTVLGYSGLIMWGVLLPASRRPFIALSAIGILIQTLLLVWLLVLRYLDLRV